MATLHLAPLKRLSRPQAPPGFRITDRDVAILRAVARFRFLTSEQIARHIGGSAQALSVRLKLLFYHAYLDRPRHQHAQLALFFDEGNRPLVYGLARKGAQLLAELGVAIDSKLDWTTKNARATATFLAHTLETADAMIAIDHECRALGTLSLLDHHQLLPYFPETTRRLRDPFCCRVEIRGKGGSPLTIGVVPDRLFSLVYPNGTRHNFALELDRGTMDVNARKLTGKSSFRRKLLAYFHAWRERRHRDVWGFQSFRVLTVTPSDKRIAHMAAAQREVTNAGAGFFLYSTPQRLAVSGALGDAWVNGDGEFVRLLA